MTSVLNEVLCFWPRPWENNLFLFRHSWHSWITRDTLSSTVLSTLWPNLVHSRVISVKSGWLPSLWIRTSCFRVNLGLEVFSRLKKYTRGWLSSLTCLCWAGLSAWSSLKSLPVSRGKTIPGIILTTMGMYLSPILVVWYNDLYDIWSISWTSKYCRLTAGSQKNPFE